MRYCVKTLSLFLACAILRALPVPVDEHPAARAEGVSCLAPRLAADVQTVRASFRNAPVLSFSGSVWAHWHCYAGALLFFVYALQHGAVDSLLVPLSLVTFVFLTVSLLCHAYNKEGTRLARFFMAPTWEEGVYRGGLITALTAFLGLDPGMMTVVVGAFFWLTHADFRPGHTGGNLPRFMGTVMVVGLYYLAVYVFHVPVSSAILIASAAHLLNNIAATMLLGGDTGEVLETSFVFAPAA